MNEFWPISSLTDGDIGALVWIVDRWGSVALARYKDSGNGQTWVDLYGGPISDDVPIGWLPVVRPSSPMPPRIRGVR